VQGDPVPNLLDGRSPDDLHLAGRGRRQVGRRRPLERRGHDLGAARSSSLLCKLSTLLS
jgi:hypothetical protein